MKSILTLTLLLFCSSLYANNETALLEPEETLSEQVASDSWQYYRIELDEPANLTVKLRNVKGDADIYVVNSRKPSESFHECAPKKLGNKAETCRIKSKLSNIWYVGVYGKEKSTYELKVESKGFSGKPNNAQYEIGVR